MVLWDEIAAEVAAEFPDVATDKMLVDAMTMRMVLKPETLDTIVATNLHADILSDLAAALAGSLGIAPTANLNPERKFPSMFEPIHGSAFDIVGKGIANPIGTFWTGVMMLDHLGEPRAAERLMRAIERVTADAAKHTPDLGGKATTRQGHRCRHRGAQGRQSIGRRGGRSLFGTARPLLPRSSRGADALRAAAGGRGLAGHPLTDSRMPRGEEPRHGECPMAFSRVLHAGEAADRVSDRRMRGNGDADRGMSAKPKVNRWSNA